MRTHASALLLASLLLTGFKPAAPQKAPPLHDSREQAASAQESSVQESSTQEAPAEMRAALEEGIKHLLVSQVEAWNQGKLEIFMQGYWRSPDLTFFSGATVTKGWEPTLQRYRQRYQAEGKEMGKLEFQDLKIDLLSKRSAVVTGKWQLTLSDGKQPHGLFTLIMKRMPPAGWKIVHDHTSAAE